jgi:hypothetical protein
MKSIFAAAALLAGSYVSAANAQDGNTIITAFTLENARSAAAAVNIPAVIENNQGMGQRIVVGTTTGGLKFFGVLTACATPPETKCAGMMLVSAFTGAPPADALHKFDSEHPFTSTFIEGGDTFLVRYEIADFGIPFGNIASNFSNFASTVEQLSTIGGAAGSVALTNSDATAAPHVGGIDAAQLAALATAAGVVNKPKIAQP